MSSTVTFSAKSTPKSKVVKSSPQGPRKPKAKATAPTSVEMVELAARFKTDFEALLQSVKTFEDFELDLNTVKVRVTKKMPLTEAEIEAKEAKKRESIAVRHFTKRVKDIDWEDETDIEKQTPEFIKEYKQFLFDFPPGSAEYKARAVEEYNLYLEEKADKKAMKAIKKPSNVPYHIYLKEENPKGKTMWAAMSEEAKTEWATANPAAEDDDRKPEARFIAAHVTATMSAWKDLPLAEKIKYAPSTSTSDDSEIGDGDEMEE